jgi:hypothetical protein
MPEMLFFRKKREKLPEDLETSLIDGRINLTDIFDMIELEPEEYVPFLKNLLYFFYNHEALENIHDPKQREILQGIISGLKSTEGMSKKDRRKMESFRKAIYAVFDRIFFYNQEVKLFLNINQLGNVIDDLMKELRNKNVNPESQGYFISQILGIEKEGYDYFIGLNRDKIVGRMITIPSEEIERSRELAELVGKYKQLEELYKEVRRTCKDDKTIVNYLDVAISQIRQIMRFRDRLTPNDIRRLTNEISKRIDDFNKIRETRKIIPAEAKRRLITGNEVLKGILSGLGLWGLAVGWFLPLWLISKMWSELEKGPFMGGKK